MYDEEKSSVLADADIFALPSQYENFANAAAEAIACGIPVIITPFCGIRSLVDGRAGLVINPEKEALAAALTRLLNDKLLYARLKEGCEEVALQLNWDHLTEQMERYYGGILVRSHGARLNALHFTTSIPSIGFPPTVRRKSTPWFRARLLI